MSIRWFGAAVAALLFVAAPMSTQAAPISRAQLIEMFANMRASAPWNIDGPLLWGYFFTDRDRSALERAGKVLTGQGYRLVEIHRDAEGLWWLHIERAERHTVDSLDARNAEFYAFARSEGLASYDGMDVGPVP